MKKKSLFFAAALIISMMFIPPVAAKDVTTTAELQEAINNGETVVTLTTNMTGDITIPAGSNITLDGASKTLTGKITFEATIVDAKLETHMTIKNLVMRGEDSKDFAIYSGNQATDPVKLYLTLENVDISGYKSKGVYLTNSQALIVTNSNFNNNASTAQTWCAGDYAFDVNLIGIQNAFIQISDSTFGGKSGGNAPIKITQRGGDDDIMTDIPYYRDATGNNRTSKEAASIAYLSIENNDFSTVTGASKGDVIIGSSPNADGSARTSATNFSYEVLAKEGTPTKVYTRSTSALENSNNYTATEVTSTTPQRNKMVAITLSASGVNETIYVPKGSRFTAEEIEQLKNLEVEGYKVANYFIDEALQQEIDLTQPFESDMIIYLKLEQIVNVEEENQPVVEVANPDTSDSGVFGYLSIMMISTLGFGYTIKKRFN